MAGGRFLRHLTAVVVAVATVAVGPAPGPATANTGREPCPVPPCPGPGPGPVPVYPAMLRITVLGDSYTSGEGMGMGVYRTVPGSNPPREDWRHQHPYAPMALAWMYLELGRRPSLQDTYTVAPLNIQEVWGTDRMTFLASSGATTYHLDHLQRDPADGSVRSAAQLAGADSGSHIAYFGFGGNDAKFSDMFEVALKYYAIGTVEQRIWPYPDWKVTQRNAVAKTVQHLLNRMPEVTTAIAEGLRKTHEAMGQAAIVVSLYPKGVKPSGNPDIPFVAGITLDAIAPFADAVNNAIRQAVAQFRAANPGVSVRIFDPNTAGPNGTSLVAGHELGQPQSYFNGVTPRMVQLMDLKVFHGLQESFHPNQLGGVALGKGLATWLAQQFPDIFPKGPAFDKVITNPRSYSLAPGVDTQFGAWVTANPDVLCSDSLVGGECHGTPVSAGGGGAGPFPRRRMAGTPEPPGGWFYGLIDVWWMYTRWRAGLSAEPVPEPDGDVPCWLIASNSSGWCP